MESKFRGLPPSKRFKLLNDRETFGSPDHQSTDSLLPPKRSFMINPPSNLLNISCCLPAKKRVWAPIPISPIKNQEVVAEPVDEDPKLFNPPSFKEKEEEEEDGVICAVCQSTDGDPTDPIVFCDGCDLMVHASCYGNPLVKSVPEGDWFCLRCERKDEEPIVACCLCPARGGATKPTSDGRWAHVLCALLVPEVFFRDPDGRDGMDLSGVPIRRWEETCYVCKSNCGCVIECSEPKCGFAFHVSCGLEAELCIELRQGKAGGIVVGFCGAHTELWKKQQPTGKFKFVPREPRTKGKN